MAVGLWLFGFAGSPYDIGIRSEWMRRRAGYGLSDCTSPDRTRRIGMQEAGRTGRAAVIGLGSMGLGMALSLRRAGFEVAGCDLSAAAVERLAEAGGTGAATPAEAAAGADIVVSVVVNAAQTESVLFGEAGCAAAMPEGAVFVSSATMAPEAARAMAERLQATGRHYLDAPISGGAQRAAEGAL